MYRLYIIMYRLYPFFLIYVLFIIISSIIVQAEDDINDNSIKNDDDDPDNDTISGRQIIPNAYLLEYVDNVDSQTHHTKVMSLLAPITQQMKIRQVYQNSKLFSGMSVQLSSDHHTRSFSSLLNMKPINDLANARKSSSKKSKRLLQPVIIDNNPWVKKIYPLYFVSRPDWQSSSSSSLMNDSSTLQYPYDDSISQIKTVHETLGYTGKDINVCLLDSGVDYRHPALGGGFGPQYKIKLGANLVDPQDDINSVGYHHEKGDPFDPCPAGGHGTHVTGIIAGMDTQKRFVGVAPDVNLGMWRIFGCEGGASEDTVIQGLTMAHQAGCDVINMSLGVQSAWAEDAMAVVADRLTQQGIIVVAVAGNQADAGAYLQNTPGTGKHVVSVASLDNLYYPTTVLLVDSIPNESFEYQLSTTTSSFPNGTLVAIYNITEKDHTPIDMCNGSEASKLPGSTQVKGNILLVQRGSCTFDQKAIEAHNHLGAMGILVYDDKVSEENGNGDDPISIQTIDSPIPVAGISRNLAHRLYRLGNGTAFHDDDDDPKKKSLYPLLPTSIFFPPQVIDKPLSTAMQVSQFSSTGPTYELDLKPNIAGIGGQVYSTLPLQLENTAGFESGWGVRSGTSMAGPHVTGIMALFLQATRKQLDVNMQSNQQIINSLVSYAMEHLQNHAKITMKDDMPDHPLLQGAGLVQPYDMIKNPIHVSPSQISFNDTSSLIDYKTHTLQITNLGGESVNLTIHHRPSKSVNPYDSKKETSKKSSSSSTFNRHDQSDEDNGNHYTLLEPVSRGDAQVELVFDKQQITLAPGQMIPIQIQVKLPSNTSSYDYQMYGGYIVWESTSDETKQASVPYFGVLGSMPDLPIFDDGFPFMAPAENLTDIYSPSETFVLHLDDLYRVNNINGTKKKKNDDDEIKSTTIPSNNDVPSDEDFLDVSGLPAVVCRMITATREIRADIILAESSSDKKDDDSSKRSMDISTTVVGYIPNFPVLNVDRNRRTLDNYYRQFVWNGEVQATPGLGVARQIVAPGRYSIRVQALRLLGDPANPNHWETWVSNPILVQ
ncbi:peptidase S8/S53 domain-containing protein [Halteromyces radiatus]|uniref:peptidase S8/S53 domain-containing protein n=1 Tax=Halteromyces radiatus TaxID=101107 RepID=UPI00222114F3|nr:peptidase S8/S53 domain-containing protein [Halteromyces radiatus]KAI8085140.1 peptidase S8/S53 domain-containing protein [Halteromyces radiatus]